MSKTRAGRTGLCSQQSLVHRGAPLIHSSESLHTSTMQRHILEPSHNKLHLPEQASSPLTGAAERSCTTWRGSQAWEGLQQCEWCWSHSLWVGNAVGVPLTCSVCARWPWEGFTEPGCPTGTEPPERKGIQHYTDPWSVPQDHHPMPKPSTACLLAG